ncbi:MAG: thioredoxin family protein [Planctomycetaceae bacterium]|nr:thioredoxin family protein [Planctomycetaceae bacterium]
MNSSSTWRFVRAIPRFACLLLATLALGLSAASAQKIDSGLFELDPSFGQASKTESQVSARLTETGESGVVRLDVTISLPPGANTYSQDPAFSKPTLIAVTAPPGLTPLGADFTPDHPPKKAFDELFQQDVEKFTDQVTFSRRFLLPQNITPATASLEGTIKFLMCDADTCLPQTKKFAAVLGAAPAEVADMPAPVEDAVAPPAAEENPLQFAYTLVPTRQVQGQAEPDPVSLTFSLSPQNPKVGETATLSIHMEVADNWRTYALQPAGPDQFEVPTELKLTELQNLAPEGDWQASPEPVIHKSEVGTSAAHEHAVTWSQTFTVREAGPVGVQGTIRYQICEGESQCLRPLTIAFSLGDLQRGEDIATAQAAVVTAVPPSPSASSGGGELGLSLESEQQISSLWMAVLASFLGGILLNVMPCVLPVLSIKILSLVQQAGESRQRILLLNLAYTAGVMSVFLALAVLAVVAGVGFGHLFQDQTFNLVLIIVVFAMGLSLLGVYELPVSGILPSSSSHKEGLVGAFSTGILATLLATPCTGGIMVPVLTYLAKQPPEVSFLIFGTMGLGMAFPYMLAGFFPRIVDFIPRPGEWMVKFKQISGFVLLGTVIWLMNSIADHLLLSLCILLLGLSGAIWMLSNMTGPFSSPSRKWMNRIATLVVCGPVVFYGLLPFLPQADASRHHLTWQPFSEARLLELRQQGKPILIDFTADWCAICKTNEAISLNTAATKAFVEEHGVEVMVADFTTEDAEILKWLNNFGQDSVPLTIIVPPGTDKSLIALRGAYTQSMLLSRLRQAFESDGSAITDSAQAPVVNVTR